MNNETNIQTETPRPVRCSAWLGGRSGTREPKSWSWCKRIDLSKPWAVEVALTLSQWMVGMNWLNTRNWLKDGNMLFVNVFIGPLRFGVEWTYAA